MDQMQGLPGIEVVRNVPLRRVAALLAHCTLYVGNDSSLMHLAAAVRTPVVALFGPTPPRLYLLQWVRSRALAGRTMCPHRCDQFGRPACVLAGACLLGAGCIQTIQSTEVCVAVKEEYTRTGMQSQT